MQKIHPAEQVLLFCSSILVGILFAGFGNQMHSGILIAIILASITWYYRRYSIPILLIWWIAIWFGRYAWGEYSWKTTRYALFWKTEEQKFSGTWIIRRVQETPYGSYVLWIELTKEKRNYHVKSTDKNLANPWDTYFYEWKLVKSTNERAMREEMKNGLSGTFVIQKKRKILSGRPSSYETGRNYIKVTLRNHMEQIMPKPESWLLAWMIVWDGQAMSKEQKDLFRETGLSHLIVASGSNVAILLWWLSIWYKRRTKWTKRMTIPIILLSVFVLMWMEMPILRASILTGILLMGKTFWRNIRTYVALLFLAVIFWCIDPFTITDDPSFQLSFLATSGVMTLTPHLEKLARQFRLSFKNDNLNDMIFWTFWATISTLPVSLVSFGNFAGAGVFANLTVLWTVPFILFGWIASLIGQFSYGPLGTLIGYVPFFALVFLEKSAQFYGNLGWYEKNISLNEWQSILFVVTIPLWMVVLAIKEVRDRDGRRETVFFGLATR